MADGLPLNLPYRAEYAKTGRASCKGCKSGIDKDELKLAFMVQSRFHDGKDATWFHVDCFFSKHRPKTVGDISHYESLRWDDQQRVKKKIDAVSAGAANGKGKKEALSDFTIAYAKSAASTCQACEEKIPKSAVRISKKDYEDERAIMYAGGAGVVRELTDGIIWTALSKFGQNSTSSWQERVFQGFKDLDKEDMAEVTKKLPAIKATVVPASKRKNDDKTEGVAGPSKKSRKEDPIEEKIRKQNQQMYSYIDSLKDYKKGDLQHILSTNKQELPTGVDKLQDRIGDIMTFGALKPCTVCKGGQYVYRSGVGYQCLGHLSEYTKCMTVTQDPERVPFRVPNDFKEDAAFAKYKYKAQKRVMQHAAPSEKIAIEKDKRKPKLVKLPLKDFNFMLFGIDKVEAKDLAKKVSDFGGAISKKKRSNLAAVVSTKEEIKKMSKDMAWAKEKGIPVVTDEFVKSVRELNYDLTEEVTKYLICDWVKDVKTWLTSINKNYEERKDKMGKERGGKFEKKMSNVKLKMKDGAVVDPESELEDIGHVLKDGKEYYSFVLNRASIEDGTNSFYKMQIIESDKGKSYWVFRSWGRIGTIIGGKTTNEDLSKHDAIDLFCAHYREKTGNIWGQPFVKKPGAYDRLEIDFGEKQHLNRLVPSEKSSQLPMAVQELVSLIFDVDKMKQAMLEFELNLEEMPLGKISRKQVLKAYAALTESVGLMEKFKSGDKEDSSIVSRRILDVSNRFYSMIPHNFGTATPPLLDTDAMIKTKMDMLENLLEIELAYELLLEGDKGGESSVDSHFKTLNCGLDIVESRSEEYNMLEKYLKNTHADTHNSYSLDLEHIFKVNRKGENKRYRPFKELHNRKLLWHGSRTTNFAGILSQGLRIAPPEAPVTGYMFGKGVYFADMVTKSANYCYPSRDNNSGLLIVCEVALGDMHELKSAKESLKKAPKDCHSVKGLGKTEPDPTETVTLPDGVEVPMGKPVPAKVKGTDLLYNEYIVYDTAQINIRYLMKVNFNFTGRR